MKEELLRLSIKYPYSIYVIRPVFVDCHKYYSPCELAVSKCENIIEAAISFNVTLYTSYLMQLQADDINQKEVLKTKLPVFKKGGWF